MTRLLMFALAAVAIGCSNNAPPDTLPVSYMPKDRQITTAPHTHLITNVNVWSPDSRRLVYDVRSDPTGKDFDGDRIETVDVETGEVKVLYTAKNGAKCGVATYHPKLNRVVFILGPENPTPDFAYGFARRQGVMVDEDNPGVAVNLDARDLSPPFTPGALRGGTHVHVFSPDGNLVSFTYEDYALSGVTEEAGGREVNLRNVGVSVLGKPVRVPKTHPRNHDGEAFTVLATRTVANPKPGSDEIKKAYEEGWLIDGPRRSLAFLGDTVDEQGRTVPEIFVADLTLDLTRPGDRPLQGTADTRPSPPKGVTQRRLTRTPYRDAVTMPRFWLRASPDGTRIGYLRPDAKNVPQLWTVSPAGGQPTQISWHAKGVESCFTWSPNGGQIAHAMNGAVCLTNTMTGAPMEATPRGPGLRPEAVVFSPDGKRIAYARTVDGHTQLFVCDIPR